jgi:hypothetical protein
MAYMSVVKGISFVVASLSLPLILTAPKSALAQASSVVTCHGIPGSYVKLTGQNYALCAGAQAVNFDEVTYAKCTKQSGTSISEQQNYPFPSTNNFPAVDTSGNIATVNQGGTAPGGYVVSTYSPPSGIALYTCDGGSYAQCDGGLCFTSTSNSSSTLLGPVSKSQIICSCPVTTTTISFQVFGPSGCPRTARDYDAICGTNVTSINNGAILYIGSPTGFPEALAACINEPTTFKKCARPRY